MRPPEAGQPRFPAAVFFLFIIVLAVFSLLLFLSNPLTDHVVSRVCSAAFGKALLLRGVRCELPLQSPPVLRVDEIDLRAFSQGGDSIPARFAQQHDLEGWLLVKDSRWVIRRKGGAWHLRLLAARTGGALARGGARLDGAGISRWNAALWLPKEVWSRFPKLVEKRFSSDPAGRRLVKVTWAGGRWRLWGRTGPVLEASWL